MPGVTNKEPPGHLEPRRFVHPPTAFGKPDAPRRRWLVPDNEGEWPQFRDAVVQHCIAIHTRRAKNATLPRMTREMLAEKDSRPSAATHWNRVLTGARAMGLGDVAFLWSTLGPDAVPEWQYVETFLGIVLHNHRPPSGWHEVDRRATGGQHPKTPGA